GGAAVPAGEETAGRPEVEGERVVGVDREAQHPGARRRRDDRPRAAGRGGPGEAALDREVDDRRIARAPEEVGGVDRMAEVEIEAVADRRPGLSGVEAAMDAEARSGVDLVRSRARRQDPLDEPERGADVERLPDAPAVVGPEEAGAGAREEKASGPAWVGHQKLREGGRRRGESLPGPA